MGEVLIKNAVKREVGYLYYVDANGSVCRAKMARKGKSKKKEIAKKKKEDDFDVSLD